MQQLDETGCSIGSAAAAVTHANNRQADSTKNPWFCMRWGVMRYCWYRPPVDLSTKSEVGLLPQLIAGCPVGLEVPQIAKTERVGALWLCHSVRQKVEA